MLSNCGLLIWEYVDRCSNNDVNTMLINDIKTYFMNF